MEPRKWYRFDDCLTAERTLLDGTQPFAGTNGLEGGMLSASATPPLHGEYLGLQFALIGVDHASIDHLPHLSSLALRLIGENLVPLTAARFPFELHVDAKGEQFTSRGLVCAELRLRSIDHRAAPPIDKLDEVETAFRRGLLDDSLRDRADFRLRIRPVIQEFEALRDSGYVPDWRVNVVFAKWQRQVPDEGEREWVTSPIPEGGTGDLSLMFEPLPRHRDFRVSDLFSTNREP